MFCTFAWRCSFGASASVCTSWGGVMVLPVPLDRVSSSCACSKMASSTHVVGHGARPFMMPDYGCGGDEHICGGSSLQVVRRCLRRLPSRGFGQQHSYSALGCFALLTRSHGAPPCVGYFCHLASHGHAVVRVKVLPLHGCGWLRHAKAMAPTCVGDFLAKALLVS